FEETPAIAFCAKKRRIDVRAGSAIGSVRAQHVIFAQGADAKPLVKEAQRVMPILTHIAVTQPIGARLRNYINYPGVILDSRVAPTDHRVVDGDRLLWGGPVTFGVPRRERLIRMMKTQIVKDYPELSNVEISHCWNCSMGYVGHRMPVIDEIAPGVWFVNA